MSEGYERGRLFNTALLASILVDAGKIDEAVTFARSAVEMAGQVRSARARGYLRDVGVRLLPHEKHSGDIQNLQREIAKTELSAR